MNDQFQEVVDALLAQRIVAIPFDPICPAER
jgi:hypothetical protein